MQDTTTNTGFASSVPLEPQQKKSKLPLILIVLIIIGFGVFFGFRNSQKKSSQEPTTSPTQEPTTEPTLEPTQEATPSPTIKLTPTAAPTASVIRKAQDLNIQVLNGSGKVGAAGEVASHLKNKGYTHIETGNADNFDYEKITIKIKESQNKYLGDIQNDLSDTYSLSSSSGTLSATGLFDVAVIVGK